MTKNGNLALFMPDGAPSTGQVIRYLANPYTEFASVTGAGALNIVGVTAGADQGDVVSTFNNDAIDVADGDLLFYEYNSDIYIYTGAIGTPAVAVPGDFLLLSASGGVYLSTAGGDMQAHAVIGWAGGTNSELGFTVLNLHGGSIDNAVIDAGTY